MEEVCDGLHVGDEWDCTQVADDWAVVHACKHPCHQEAVGYRGSLPQEHPEYLVADRGRDLYVNLVDMERQLDHQYTEPIVTAALDFIDEHLPSRDVLIHCNEGRSRSPALALLYVAKRAAAVPGDDYRTGTQAFLERYPGFRPGGGVNAYLAEYWDYLE